MEVPACLSGTQTWEGGWGEGAVASPLQAFEALGSKPERKRGGRVSWSVTQGPKSPPSGHCMTGAFFGVFGAATKCAMCYVAWFIIFLQATKLICSPIV